MIQLLFPLSSLDARSRGWEVFTCIRHPLLWVSISRRCQDIMGRLSAGLCPSLVSSLDVAHSLIQPEFCLFTLGRHKEIRGVREGKRVREELSSHIWVDGTHGESTLQWSGFFFRHFFFTASSAFHVPQSILVYFCKIHFPLSLCHPLSFLLFSFYIYTFYFYPIRLPYTRSSPLPSP